MKIAYALAAAAHALVLASPATTQDGTRMMEQMTQADTNRDGKVSKSEFLTYRAQRFDRLDRDENGVLNDDDMPRMARIAEMIKQRTAAMDADGNGVITRTEFKNGPTTAFELADANADGLVTTQQLQAARAKLEEMSKRKK